jgi:hypothetical protein
METRIIDWLGPGEGGADCAESPPSVQPAVRPDPASPCGWSIVEAWSVAVASGSRSEGPAGSGVNGLTPGPLRLLGRLSPAGQRPAACDAHLPLPPITNELGVRSLQMDELIIGRLASRHIDLVSGSKQKRKPHY